MTPTGGYLGGTQRGFSHTFNPAVGCAFARGFCGRYCYAQGFATRMAGAGSWGERVLLKRNAPALLEAELERAARRPPEHPNHLSQLRVFSASVTDPCAGPVLELYRQCLQVVARYPLARWVVQTRSPAVVELEAELRALADRAVVSFTLETDDEQLWRSLPPGSPSIGARRRAVEILSRWPVPLHLSVSPCLALRDRLAFADWIAEHADAATIDTFTTGDGSGGKRTASSSLPNYFAELGLDWRNTEEARALYDELRVRVGERAGWSVEGFLRMSRT